MAGLCEERSNLTQHRAKPAQEIKKLGLCEERSNLAKTRAKPATGQHHSPPRCKIAYLSVGKRLALPSLKGRPKRRAKTPFYETKCRGYRAKHATSPSLGGVRGGPSFKPTKQKLLRSIERRSMRSLRAASLLISIKCQLQPLRSVLLYHKAAALQRTFI